MEDMHLILRWHGEKDPISLRQYAQIPNLYGIVTSLYHLPLGQVWDRAEVLRLNEQIEAHGLKFELVDSFRKILRERGIEKEFLIAGEALYDFQFDEYDLAYGRTWGRDHRPVSRLMRPHGQIMTAVVGFYDRSMINQCLLNRYIISYEPYNFKGRPSDYPQTVAYGMKMDRLRRDLSAYFWDGEWMGRRGGAVAVEGRDGFGDYAVFQNQNGRSGMVIVNYDEENSITVTPVLNDGQTLSRYRLVDDDELTCFEGSFDIPPMSAAAVI